MKEEVILVDRHDRPVGVMEKLEAHQKGALHRAFSIFIFNSKKELLMQRRALDKYHSPGLWSNTCCSHPRPGEDTLAAAKRRLNEEMGMDAELHYKAHFIYRAQFDNQLTEHEYDHVFLGLTNQEPVINRDEVHSYQWLAPEKIKSLISSDPEKYTVWFKIAMEKLF